MFIVVMIEVYLDWQNLARIFLKHVLVKSEYDQFHDPGQHREAVFRSQAKPPINNLVTLVAV